ncbi:hypothetical protein HanRHA438_Chr03g0146001 [Helianthus annuus]|nr:hypothetical protein HanRHA438_Chr03g0146001 [Helianthus annuus]
MVHWTEEEEIALVTSIVDAQRTLQRGQTAYWGQAFQQYQQHVSNTRHNLNACQHKWRELKPKLDWFKVCFNRVPTGDLSHEDRMEIAKIDWRHDGNPKYKWIPHFHIYRTL